MKSVILTESMSLYFPNLNGIRFFAAAMVFFSHVEWMKSLVGIRNMSNIPFVFKSGGLGVTLFFVLSGFLITALLLKEKEKTGTIKIHLFYLRRILRIWPVYYLTVFLSFFVFTHLLSIPSLQSPHSSDNFYSKLVLFISMLPNVSYVVYPIVPFASQLWSVGVEEQFYLIWPHLIKYSPFRTDIMLFMVIIILLVVRLVLEPYAKFQVDNIGYYFREFFQYFRIQCMAIGALFSYYLLNDKVLFIRLVLSPLNWLFALAASLILQYKNANLGVVEHEVYSFLYAIIIANFAFKIKWTPNLENSILKYLGSISYGLYIYHILAISICMRFLGEISRDMSVILYNVALYSLSFCLTCALSILSYHFMETYFLKLKSKFAPINSGQ